MIAQGNVGLSSKDAFSPLLVTKRDLLAHHL